MDIELTHPEYFTPEPVNVLEVMETEREIWSFQNKLDEFISEGKTEWAGRLGRWMDNKFNLGLANK